MPYQSHHPTNQAHTNTKIHTCSGCLHWLLFSSPSAPERTVLADYMNKVIKLSVRALDLERFGLHLRHVGSHSLRAGGAMAMHLSGVKYDVIKKMGRYSSNTFLMYIHEQISALSAGVSTQMSQQFVFHNIAFQRAVTQVQKSSNNCLYTPTTGPTLYHTSPHSAAA